MYILTDFKVADSENKPDLTRTEINRAINMSPTAYAMKIRKTKLIFELGKVATVPKVTQRAIVTRTHRMIALMKPTRNALVQYTESERPIIRKSSYGMSTVVVIG